MSWEKVRVHELRDKLVSVCGYDEEAAANIKGKADLIYELVQTNNKSYEDLFGEDGEILDVDLDAAEPTQDSILDGNDYLEHLVNSEPVVEMGRKKIELPSEEELEEGEAAIRHIMYGGPGWCDYVMSLFKESELDKEGHPKLPGLRRVTEMLLGEILDSGPIRENVLVQDTGIPHVSIVYEIVIAFRLDLVDRNTHEVSYLPIDDMQIPKRRFRAIASAGLNNTDDDFAIFPEAMAESRAESRCYRKALLIESVTADELTSKSGTNVVQELKQRRKEKEAVTEYDDSNVIGHHQKNFIEKKCIQLGVDVGKFSAHELEMDFTDKMTKANALALIDKLNEYQTNPESIPEEVK